MNWKALAVSLAAGLACLFLATIPASAATPCIVTYPGLLSSEDPSGFYEPGMTQPLDLNAEGLTERSADIVISGVGCFNAGSVLEISFNAVITLPGGTPPYTLDYPTYWNFYDASGALNISSVTVTQPQSSTGLVSKILISINGGTIDPSAEILVKNLRFDVTGTTGGTSKVTPVTAYETVPDGGTLFAYVDTTNPATGAAPFPIGYVYKTIASSSVSEGWGFEDGICPFTACPYPNKGGSGSPGYLLQQATWSFTTNSAIYSTGPAWALSFAFRYQGQGYQSPAVEMDPYAIGPTDLIVDVEEIPSGVTVTLPSNLLICSSGTAVVTWTLKTSPSGATGSVIGIYTTSSALVTGGQTLTVTTGMTASATCSNTPPNTIGVVVNDPSGNNPDGNMLTDLRVVMAPGLSTSYGAAAATFAGDELVSSLTPPPVYTNNITSSAPTREIIGDPYGNPVPYFYLNPTETVLLFPYVTNLMGWDTGLEIANTGLDGAVFGNTGQTGALDFYIFPSPVDSTATQYACTTAISPPATNTLPTCKFGRGLTTTGTLAPGSDFADTISDLLSAIGQAGASFDGYVIVVAHFNFAHGNAILIDTTTSWTVGEPALVLGGHCSYSKHNAQPLVTGAPKWPACSSARQGDITKLPEQLNN